MTRPVLILLCGIPGSGKTTWAKNYISKNPDFVHLSSDAIRAELYGDENIQGNPVEVFTLMQKKAVESLNAGYNVVYDATSMTRKDRAGIISMCPKFTHIQCNIIWAPIETCIERDTTRERTVGKEVIDRMLKRFQMPYYDEGIDEISIVQPGNFNRDTYFECIINAMKIPHDNPHHQLDIYNHCMEAFNYAVEKNFDWEIREAAYCHDCGKPYVKSFVNTKGELSDVAHYYQHQCVGAWIACGLTFNIHTIWLISTHMAPFLNEKYYKNLSPYLKTMVDQLHECDVRAH